MKVCFSHQYSDIFGHLLLIQTVHVLQVQHNAPVLGPGARAEARLRYVSVGCLHHLVWSGGRTLHQSEHHLCQPGPAAAVPSPHRVC